ncbi:PREDICTED: uncharacterized protein LOC109226055 [Nicotiana attenuata]|uniref:uncharacterized protein LOC109226055 n=1 Tax=Nicotiana attenuata TaxID=49451 RepID=UPI000904C378|nr:PREDICTED: uncharacterized protein LOC109226055 [Nicotiana attenuata]
MARDVEMGTPYQLVVEIARRIEGYRLRGREKMQQDKRARFSGEEIAKQLQKDSKTIVIQYAIAQGYPPITICSDMSVSVYMELKKSSAGMTTLPLCVSFAKNTIVASTSSFDVAPISSEIAEFESTDMITTFDVQEGDDAILELDDANIITDQFHQNVENGQIYEDKNLLALVMKQYILECVDERCTWRLKASSLRASNLFKLTDFNSVYSCLTDKRFCSQKQVVSAFVAAVVQDKLVDPETIYTPTDIQRDIQKAYGMDLSYMQAWRSKEKAMQLLRRSPSESYKKMPTYLYKLEYANPGSVTRLHTEGDESFLYAFIAMYASIRGWVYCRPTVVVDGSFLKSTYRGTILTASTQDAEGQILPLAYATVDSENDASWEWFFVQFRETYGQREGMCIVSDMHDAIWKATSIVYPEVPHCASRAYTVEEFNRHMAELEAIDSRVKTYLMDIGYDKWSRAHSKANRTMTMTSNITESVNAANKHARDLPVVNLLDFMTTLIQKWNYTNQKDAVESFMKIGAKYEKILSDNTILSQTMTVLSSTEFLHLVIDGQTRNVVRLHEKNCTCGRFQLDDIPCPHAMAVIQKFHMDSYKYCSDYYSIEYLLKTYEIPVNPLPDETTWQIPEHVSSQVVLPPKGKIKPGRPKKKRGIGGWEGNTVTCALCGRKGHNRRTCRNISKRD